MKLTGDHKTDQINATTRFCNRNGIEIKSVVEQNGRFNCRYNGLIIIIWATTGSWSIKQNKIKGKGLKELLKALNVEEGND